MGVIESLLAQKKHMQKRNMHPPLIFYFIGRTFISKVKRHVKREIGFGITPNTNIARTNIVTFARGVLIFLSILATNTCFQRRTTLRTNFLKIGE